MSSAVLPGGEARRPLVDGFEASADSLRRVAQKHRNVQMILERPDRIAMKPEAQLAQAGNPTTGLDEARPGGILVQRAQPGGDAGRGDHGGEHGRGAGGGG